MKKILFASHSAFLSGAPQVVYNIVTNLDRAQFEPLVLFPEHGLVIDRFRAANVPTAVIDIGDSLWGKRHIPMIEAFCIAKEIDLVHANTVLGFPFVVASEKCGIPCFWHIHEMLDSGVSFSIGDDELKITTERASRIGVVSHASEQMFLQKCRSLELANPDVVLVYNGVEVPETFRLYDPMDSIELLSVGTLVPHKGYHVLMESLAMLNSAGREASLTILAGGSLMYFSQLWEAIEKAGVENQVKLMTPELDVTTYIQEADIVVNPSLVENFSLAIAEAMSYAKPIVATDVGGTRELLVNEESGLLVPPQDSEALARAILRFIENPEFARQCGEKARERIATEFPVEKQVKQLQDIYLSLLSSSGSSPGSELPQHVRDVYDLVSEALAAAGEKFHRIDMEAEIVAGKLAEAFEQMDKHFMEDQRLASKLAEAFAAIKHIDDRQRNLEVEALAAIKHIDDKIMAANNNQRNLEKDIRNLETVVDNLLRRLPFRMYRKLKSIFRRWLDGLSALVCGKGTRT